MEDAHRQHKTATGYPAAQPSYPHGAMATAYPYPAPPPGPYYPPERPFNPRRATLLRRLIAAAIAVLIIFGTISFILWLVLRPRLPDFSISSASVNPFNLSSTQLTADWDIVFSVRNPNKKMTVEYSTFDADVIYGSIVLAGNTLPPFSQAKRNETSFGAHLAASSSYVNGDDARALEADRARGSIEFRVRLVSWVRFRTGAWRTRSHLMRVWCRHVVVGFSSPQGAGSLSGGRRACEVDL